MNRAFITVTLTLHDGDPIEVADYVDDNGKFVNIGYKAEKCVARREAVQFVDADGVETFIPFHAIIGVQIGREVKEVPDAEDKFCVSGVTPSGCDPESSIVDCAQADKGKAA